MSVGQAWSQYREVQMGLLETWAKWEPKGVPYVLGGDEDVLASKKSQKAIITHSSWDGVVQTSDYCAPNDKKLHLGLLPQPFCGDIQNASIYFLLLNPGLGPGDYFGEYQVPAFRNALLANLKQEFENDATPFLFLDPQFSWHCGFTWWHKKLDDVIARVAKHRRESFAEARKQVGSAIASIELMPYHSASFRDADCWLRKLPSVRLAREYVTTSVLPRVQGGQAIVIVMRQVATWDVAAHAGVITYTAGQARGGYLSPESPGGQAILRHFKVPTERADGMSNSIETSQTQV